MCHLNKLRFLPQPPHMIHKEQLHDMPNQAQDHQQQRKERWRQRKERLFNIFQRYFFLKAIVSTGISSYFQIFQRSLLVSIGFYPYYFPPNIFVLFSHVFFFVSPSRYLSELLFIRRSVFPNYLFLLVYVLFL